MISLRWILPEEFHKLDKKFEEFDWNLPSYLVSSILVVEEGSAIIGFLCIQLMPFIGPAWIQEDRRGQGIWAEAIEMVKERLGENYAGAVLTATSETVERIAERLGMGKSKDVFYMKDWR